ncbi:hypothetical protein QBC39DRAFT_364592 [Podospora conica]|nr:hypothetical protein QBC39DRAFT_364592 [Schizothecium conicum]
MRSPGAVPWIAIVVQFASLVAGQLSDAPSVQNFVRRFSGAVVVVGNYAYLDGGEVIQMEGGNISAARPVSSTLSLDLTKSWALTDAVFKSTPKGVSPSKGNAAAWANREGTAFYSWGGKSPFGINLTTPALYKFTVDGNGGGSWGIESPQNPNLFSGLLPAEVVALATVNNTMYGIGGVASAWSTPSLTVDQVVPGMITFNMDTKEWTNETGTKSPIATLTAGRAQYLPSFGPQGLIIVMGGHAPRADLPPTIGNSRLNEFDTLTFFDPVTRQTYSQTATGDIPPFPRAGFCTAEFQNKQGGHEIFVFGGESTLTKVRYEDAYVLSLPAFVWTKLPDSPFGGRAFFACAAVGKSQILTVGGLEFTTPGKDDAPMGLQIFDMNAMQWKDRYDATLGDYERPDVISAFYTSGGLDKVQWSSKEVQSLFVTNSGGSQGAGGGNGGSGSNGSGNGNSNTPQNEASSPAGTSAGAIAGGVVGGILALAALGAAVWFLLRRRRQKKEGISFSPPPARPDVAEMGAPGQLYPDGGHPGALPPSYGQPGKYGPTAGVVEADTFAYVEADGSSPYAELSSVRLDRRTFAAELDGASAAKGEGGPNGQRWV